jgi:hypothetical protein
VKFAIALLCLLLLACGRADELLAAAVLEALAEPRPHSEHAADCARGADRMAGPGIQLLVHCEHVDAGRVR